MSEYFDILNRKIEDNKLVIEKLKEELADCRKKLKLIYETARPEGIGKYAYRKGKP